MNKIISIHIPKTGGTTFQNLLESKFDDINIQVTKPLFYRCENKQMAKLDVEEFNSSLLHGHMTFDQVKYNKEYFYLSWLRDPVERVISHYYYWKSKSDFSVHPIEYRIKHENLSLIDFCKIPCMQNVQSFFLGDDIELFDFIGITEEFEKSLSLLNKKISLNFEYNKSQNKRVNNEKEYVSDHDKKIILEYNRKDYEYYQKAKKKLGIE